MHFTLRPFFVARATLVGLFCLAVLDTAQAQLPGIPTVPNIPGVSGTTQRNVQIQQAGQQNVNTLAPSIEIYQPVAPEERAQAPISRLENLYSARAGAGSGPAASASTSAGSLRQFGYDILGVPSQITAAQVGAGQEDYILGAGDEIVVVLRGQEDATYRERVNRDGQVILPRLNPIQATGRSFGDFRDDLERQVAQTYISTNAFVSLGEVRQISVLVTGDVRAPGARILSALASPLDALLISGGIAKTGSLRNVTLMRGNQTRVIDFYSVLNQGGPAGLGTLQNGDRLYVPPLEDTVAISGIVRRQGIYELKRGETSIEAAALIALAGGYEITGNYRLSKVRIEPDGSTRLVPLSLTGLVASGEVLFVDNAVDQRNDTVQLMGAVRLPTSYPLAAASSVGQLIRSVKDLDPNAYTAFALVVRRDLALNAQSILTFSLARVISKQQDVPLQNEDRVYIFNLDEARNLAAGLAADQRGPTAPVPGLIGSRGAPDTRAAAAGLNASGAGALNGGVGGAGGIAPGAPDTRAAAAGLNASGAGALNGGVGGAGGIAPPGGPTVATTALAEAQATINREAGAVIGRVGAVGSPAGIATRLDVPERVLTATGKDNLIFILDEITNPGAYLAATGTTIGEMALVAGGPLRTADLSSVEVTSTTIDTASGTSRTSRTVYKGSIEDLKRVALLPLDVVRFRPVYSDREVGRITLSGEVRYPGTFDIVRGERLSAVLARAGGLTAQAYPYGAVFARRSAAIAESEGNQREARELESALATAIQPAAGMSQAGDSGGVIGALISELRNAPALGRITVTADPALLAVHPELDIIVDADDTLYIPKRPSIVTVTGEVLNSGSFQYRPEFDAAGYLDMAGGTRGSADKSRIFVILPDGSASPLQESWVSFNRGGRLVPPGSTIIVPRDVTPFNLRQFLTDVTQITSQLAITAAAVTILGR